MTSRSPPTACTSAPGRRFRKWTKRERGSRGRWAAPAAPLRRPALWREQRKAPNLPAPSGSAWVALTTEYLRPSKENVLNSWSHAAGTKLGGHSARRSGALFYVRAGLTIPEITFLGRWHSDLVFRYAEEAWEDKAWTTSAPPTRRQQKPKVGGPGARDGPGRSWARDTHDVSAGHTTSEPSRSPGGQAHEDRRQIESGPPDGPLPDDLFSIVEDEVRMAIRPQSPLYALRGAPGKLSPLRKVPAPLEKHRGKPPSAGGRCIWSAGRDRSMPAQSPD